MFTFVLVHGWDYKSCFNLAADDFEESTRMTNSRMDIDTCALHCLSQQYYYIALKVRILAKEIDGKIPS